MTVETLVRYFEEIGKSDRAELRNAGCLVNQVKNTYSKTHIHTSKKTVWMVTFPVDTHEDVKDQYAGLIPIRTETYRCPNGEYFSIYRQGVESASLRHAPYLKR